MPFSGRPLRNHGPNLVARRDRLRPVLGPGEIGPVFAAAGVAAVAKRALLNKARPAGFH